MPGVSGADHRSEQRNPSCLSNALQSGGGTSTRQGSRRPSGAVSWNNHANRPKKLRTSPGGSPNRASAQTGLATQDAYRAGGPYAAEATAEVATLQGGGNWDHAQQAAAAPVARLPTVSAGFLARCAGRRQLVQGFPDVFVILPAVRRVPSLEAPTE